MRYLYDESNNPVGFGMQYPTETKWENYYFAKNVQGDIVAIYRYDYDASTQKPYGTLIATYQYDPWGNPQGIKDASGKTIAQTANHVATYNPFRYRGYRYDGDTGLYYLQSRYYDPMTCRFVNADRYASTGQGLAGCNMFAYCNNNPVICKDSEGTLARTALVNDGGSSTSGGRTSPDSKSTTGALPDPKPTPSSSNKGNRVPVLVCLTIMSNGEIFLTHLIGETGTYDELRSKVRSEAMGMGLQVHHLIEKRFLAVDQIGKIFSSPNEMPCVILDRATHQIYTNDWRKAFAYGTNYAKVNYSEVVQFCRSEYSGCGGGSWLQFLSEWIK